MGGFDSPEAEGIAKPEGALKTAGRAFLHSAFQDPLDGVSQLVNHVAGHQLIPGIHFVDAPAQAKFGSSDWFAETIGSGFGMIVPYLAVEGATNVTLGRLGTIAEKVPMGADLLKTMNMSAEEAASAGWLADSVRFAAPASKMALNGAVYGLVMTPSNDPNKGFWTQRGIAAGSSAITFGAMGLASSGIMAGAEAKFHVPVNDAAFNLSLKGIGLRMGSNALGGSVGGFFSAESNSILNGNGAATPEQIGKSMASFMVTGAALDSAHIAGEYYQSALAQARVRAADEAEEKSLPKLSAADQQMLEKIQEAHFRYFQQESDPITGLTKDRSTDMSPASIAAVGFSLTAHGVAIDHGWISHDEGADYTLKVLNTLWNSKQGPEAEGTSGDHGFFYHFLDPKTGTRSGQNELSTIDTALLMSGVLFSKNYFTEDTPKDAQIRDLSTKLFNRVDWNWALKPDGRLSMGWNPESGFIPYEWQAYNEAPIMLLMGMGSPTHPLPADAWLKYMATAKTSDPYGHEGIEFGPLFGHQYSQVWLDLRGIKDATMKKLGSDYFENSRQATLAQHDYAVDNPQKFRGYSALDWGLTASDGPANLTKVVDGINRTFQTYSARGFPDSLDDGTIAPTAAASSLPFAPEIVMPTLRHWMAERPEIMGALGFADAFNPTFGEAGKTASSPPDKAGSSGWVDKETLGIDQGPILLMADNYRTNGVWRTMDREPVFNTGLERAGFSQRQMPSVSYFAPITYGVGRAFQSVKKSLSFAP